MKEFCFLIDTSFDFTFDLGPDVFVLPPEIIKTMNAKEIIYQDTINISRDDVRKFLANGADIKTSQTPYGIIQSKLEELLTKYKTIYCIVITKDFSGMFNTYTKIANSFEKKYGKNRIFVIDSKAAIIDQNWILDIVRKGAEKKENYSSIKKSISNLNAKLCGFTIISDATQLIKGGRLSGLKAILVKALSIKLIIRYKEGALKFIDKTRDIYTAIDKGFNDAYNQLKIPKNKLDKVVIFSDLNEEDTNKLSNYVKNKLDSLYEEDIIVSKFPTIIIAHLGDSSFSVLFKIK